MKDMLFSIDMIWLDEAKRVITIKEGVAPETYPTTFCPDSAAKYGLEISSGGARRLGVSPGVRLAF
jgi:uncharacterized membrane protein (UPF0127 family)